MLDWPSVRGFRQLSMYSSHQWACNAKSVSMWWRHHVIQTYQLQNSCIYMSKYLHECQLNPGAWLLHYNDVIMSALASQITSLDNVYSTVYSRHRSKKTSKLRVTGLCAGNSPAIGEFPAQRTSNAKNVSIWWSHHGVRPRTQQGLQIPWQQNKDLAI